MKIQFALCFLAFAAVMVLGQETTNNFPADRLFTYGTGVVLVPIDRAAITVTVTGSASTASQAVSDANNLQTTLNDTLKNFTIIDVRYGGLYLQPLYTGSSLTFAAHASLSLVINSVDLPTVIDSMVSLGASNISFIFTPDFFAVERAQRQSLQLAIADALFKAQSVLDMVQHCAGNISGIAIRNPVLELPSLTFNIFANMGSSLERNLHNFRPSSGTNDNINANNLNNNLNMNNNMNNRNNMNARPMLLGAAAPFLEGDREEVVSYVEVYITHSACQGANRIDLTSSLDLTNIVGIAGGSFEGMMNIPVAPEGSTASPSSPSSPMGSRSVRSTMW